MSNLMKIISLGAEMMRMDRQADMPKLIGTFANLAKAPTNYKKIGI
jgi:hypothetical protein